MQVELPLVCCVDQLYSYNVRISFVPSNIPPSVNYKFSLLKAEKPEDVASFPNFRDILTSSDEVAKEALKLKKRLFFLGKNKKAFCEILDSA